MKTAFIYPGQGSQYVGMASEFYRDYIECKEVIDTASEIVDFDLKKIMFEENEWINQTEYTQITMLVASRCMEKAVEIKGYKAEITAGLSLGEFNALITAGVIEFEDALNLVRIRGKLMQNAVPVGLGGMAAIIRVSEERIQEVCKMVSEEMNLVVQISNYNCIGEYVISGDMKAVDKVSDILKKEARLISKLNVSVPSHCKLMKDIASQFSEEVKKIPMKNPQIPYISNVTGKIINDKSQIASLLVKQLYSPVLWYQSINTMIEMGINQFIEVGPGRVLTSYISRINKSVEGISMQKLFGNYNLKA